jgi:hypothetical protein
MTSGVSTQLIFPLRARPDPTISYLKKNIDLGENINGCYETPVMIFGGKALAVGGPQ